MANEMFGIGDDHPTAVAEQKPQTVKTEIAKVEAKPPVIHTGDRGLQLATLDDAWRFAGMALRSGLAPQSFKSQEAIMVAMQYGAEVGLTPMQSLQSIAVINGRPSMYGDALPGLVLGSGLCDGTPKEWIEGEGEKMVAHCEAKRKDSTEPVRRSFSVADAEAANLWDKAGPWKQYPKRMLQMRARAFCLRDAFADVLRGMQVREEVEDIPRAEHTAPEGYTLPTDE